MAHNPHPPQEIRPICHARALLMSLLDLPVHATMQIPQWVYYGYDWIFAERFSTAFPKSVPKWRRPIDEQLSSEGESDRSSNWNATGGTLLLILMCFYDSDCHFFGVYGPEVGLERLAFLEISQKIKLVHFFGFEDLLVIF